MSELGLVFAEAPVAPDCLQILLYGPTGSGKSTAAATAPGPFIWLNVEGGNALAFPRSVARKHRTEINELTIDPKPGGATGTGQDVRELLRDVVRHVRSGAEPKAATIVIDTIGKLRTALASQLVVQGSRNTQQQWGDVAEALMGFLRAIRDENVNLVVLAHESIEDADGERIIRPLVASSGALPEDVLSEMDVVAYCAAHREEDQIRYMGQLVEGRGRRAKDRSGGLGTVRDLNLTDWIAVFRAALQDDEDVPWGIGYAADENPAADTTDLESRQQELS